MKSLNERVAAGAAYLDETQPGWERMIDLAALNLADSCRCVLAQIEYAVTDRETVGIAGHIHFVTSFGFSRDGYGEALLRRRVSLGWPEDHGFTVGVDGSHQTWEDLDEAWITCIKDRFDSGALSDQDREEQNANPC